MGRQHRPVSGQQAARHGNGFVITHGVENHGAAWHGPACAWHARALQEVGLLDVACECMEWRWRWRCGGGIVALWQVARGLASLGMAWHGMRSACIQTCAFLLTCRPIERHAAPLVMPLLTAPIAPPCGELPLPRSDQKVEASGLGTAGRCPARCGDHMRQPNAPHSRHAASIRPSCSDKKVEAEWTPQMEGEATHYYLTNYIGKCPGPLTALEVAVLQGSQVAIWAMHDTSRLTCYRGLLPTAVALSASSQVTLCLSQELQAANFPCRCFLSGGRGCGHGLHSWRHDVGW